MAWRDKPMEGKRFFHWLFAIGGLIIVALKLLSPRPLHAWDYLAVAVFSVLTLSSAYSLVTERTPDA